MFFLTQIQTTKAHILKRGTLEKKDMKGKKPGQICPLILKGLMTRVCTFVTRVRSLSSQMHYTVTIHQVETK